MASEFALSSSGGQRRLPGEDPPLRRLLAVVRQREEQWVFESGGESEVGETQLDAQFAAVRYLMERGGGELLIRDSDGRQAKRLIVEPTPEAETEARG